VIIGLIQAVLLERGIHSPMALTQRDTQHHTYGDYLTWSDDHREELIDGIAYIREPPAPSPLHQELVGELYYQVRTALEGKPGRVYIAPFDVRLPKSDETDDQIDTVVQPDVLIVCNRHRLDQRGMRGAPDWLAEVLSPSTASHDQIIKIPAYERAGVPEVWLIHPTDRTLTIYRIEDGRYGRPAILELKGQTPLTAVPGVSIDWDRLQLV
jgi:Uma2 family endonuclease